MAQQALAVRHEAEEMPLEEMLEDVGMTEEEFDAIVEESFRDLKVGKLGTFEQLTRECGLD